MNADRKETTFDNFRRWGYLQAQLDGFGRLKPASHPALDVGGDDARQAREYYCGSIGAEFMHIPDTERCLWIQERMESHPGVSGHHHILERLVHAEIFEQVLQRRYPGTKRFSLEGLASLIPLLDEILKTGAEQGTGETVIGMSHRGRLNVMVQIIGTPPADVFAEFEDVDARSVLGGGDVKYHTGATGVYGAQNISQMQVRLVSNPSHLEAVNPVALGRVRAKQARLGKDGHTKVLPILIHGDAAFAGQGIAAETLNLATVEGFSVGGTIHIICNNLIGFTANPDELYSSRFSSDLAKRLPIPILHVNAEDPEAAVRSGHIATAYRSRFGSDVVIDLIGFRRHGHSEIDDPTVTQPLLYNKIKSHPPLWQLYAEKLGEDPESIVRTARSEYENALAIASTTTKRPQLSELPAYWEPYRGGPYRSEYEVDTGVTREELVTVAEAISGVPGGFSIHPKVQRFLERRKEMVNEKIPVDFGMAELLAWGTLLRQGIPVRLSGQDSQRGTFGQRHVAWIDVTTGEKVFALSRLSQKQAWFEAYNSILSEAAVLGFEYGFSREYPDALVIWEAQFGDFANGAQVIIDQFIAAGEDKWGLLSGIVMLLPHGYEGQGPEHSNGRIERFLQIAAEDNIQISQPSTSAQYFHLLRRQALRSWRKPLIVFTPKSMLRLPAAGSPLKDLTRPRFMPVLPDQEHEDAERVLVCSGKIGHELRAERERRGDAKTAIVFLEQLYPFPEKELTAHLRRHRRAKEIVWIQEEPANMGALRYVMPGLEQAADGLPVRSVKRSASASPATGSARAHEVEQRALLTLALDTGAS